MEDALALLEIAGSCLRGEKPPCSCACPLGLDVRDFITKIKSGSFSAAYKVFSKSAVFPEIVSRICEEPCQSVCVRSQYGGPISLKALESACCSHTKAKASGSYYIPPKNKEILVAGGGLTGLSCAVMLAKRGYQVNLFEMKDRLGGRLWDIDEKTLPRDILENEIKQVTGIDYLTIKLSSKVESLDDHIFDAALVATGAGGDTFGASVQNGSLFLKETVLFGGSLLCGPAEGASDESRETHPSSRQDSQLSALTAKQAASPLFYIREGIELSYEIESVVKVGAVKHTRAEYAQCKFGARIKNPAPATPAEAASPDGYTADEAKLEAERCLLCDCSFCADACHMLKYYRKDPKKVILDVTNTVNKTNITTKAALRQILSCTQCGSCKSGCPAGVDFKTLFIESRRIMHKTGAMPESLHEFWLNDMELSNGAAAFSFAPPENSTPKYLFFPGCQMGASDPLYVTKTYDMLIKAYPHDVAIMLHCCGAPAYWAGRDELHGQTAVAIKSKWEQLGKPRVILACPTCADMFGKLLPELSVASLWGILAQSPYKTNAWTGKTASVFDPCSSKISPDMQEDIRKIVKDAGFDLEELPIHGENAGCCGYGGLAYSASAELAGQVAESNVLLGARDYIAYCVNCRDSFSLYGKPAYHILDILLFGDENRKLRTPPSLTERRSNRLAVKKTMLKEIWDVDFDDEKEPYHSLRLNISREVTDKLNRELIHQDNVKKTIYQAETGNNKVLDPESGSYSSHLLQGYTTYWITYKPSGDGSFDVLNAYKHRMKIEE